MLTLLLSTMGRTAYACNKDTKEVGICLHVYLERDFPAIEPAVYRMHHAGRSTGRNSKLLEDYAFSGPSLEDSCKFVTVLQNLNLRFFELRFKFLYYTLLR